MIPIPSPDDVPAGPHRRLLLAVHQLYRDAGKPGVHYTSRAIRARSDLRDTISHEAISKILHGKVVPRRWQKIEALIRQYLDWSVGQPSSEERAVTVRKIQDLWHQTTEGGGKAVANAPLHGSVTLEDSITVTPKTNRELLYPEDVVSEAMKLPDQQARDLIMEQTRVPGRELIPLVAALMPTLPGEGIRLLRLAGITHDLADDPYIADLVAQIQRYPADTWRGHNPLRLLLRGVSKRWDCGAHLLEVLADRHNDAGVQAYMTLYAERTSALGAAELVRELAKTHDPRFHIGQFLRTVDKYASRGLASQVPEQLRQLDCPREAKLMTRILAGA